jgi:hypothetical protein
MVTLRGDILVEWMSRSACKDVGAGPERDDFFGVEENAPMTKVEVANARFLCRAVCPVQRECLKSSLSGEEGWGVWGGYTAPERQRAFKLLVTTRAIMEAFDDGILDRLVRVRG